MWRLSDWRQRSRESDDAAIRADLDEACAAAEELRSRYSSQPAMTGLDVAVELGKSEGRAPTWGIHAFLYRDGKVHESWQPIARRERKPEGWTLVTSPEVAAERVEDDLRNWLHTAR